MSSITGGPVPAYISVGGSKAVAVFRAPAGSAFSQRRSLSAVESRTASFSMLFSVKINISRAFFLVKWGNLPFSGRKSQAKNAVLFQQTILRYFVHFGQHEKATRQSPAGSLCFIVLFPCYFRVLCVRFSLKYERTGAARPPPPSTRPAPCSHSARLKPSLGSCSSRFGFA